MLLIPWPCNSLIFAIVTSRLDADKNLMSEVCLSGIVGSIYCYCLDYRLHSRLDTGITSWKFHSRGCGGSLHPQLSSSLKFTCFSAPTAHRARKNKNKNSNHLHSHQRIHTAIKTFRPTVRSNQKTVYINTTTMRNVPYAGSS
jgi:hypothetical protein